MSDQPVAPAGGASERGEPAPGRRLHAALRQFWASLDAIRHLDEHLAPRAAALDEDRLSPAALTAIGSLSTERQEQLRVWWEQRVPPAASQDTPSAARPDDPVPPADNDVRIDKPAEGDISAEHDEPDGQDSSDVKDETAAANNAKELTRSSAIE